MKKIFTILTLATATAACGQQTDKTKVSKQDVTKGFKVALYQGESQGQIFITNEKKKFTFGINWGFKKDDTSGEDTKYKYILQYAGKGYEIDRAAIKNTLEDAIEADENFTSTKEQEHYMDLFDKIKKEKVYDTESWVSTLEF